MAKLETYFTLISFLPIHLPCTFICVYFDDGQVKLGNDASRSCWIMSRSRVKTRSWTQISLQLKLTEQRVLRAAGCENGSRENRDPRRGFGVVRCPWAPFSLNDMSYGTLAGGPRSCGTGTRFFTPCSDTNLPS